MFVGQLFWGVILIERTEVAELRWIKKVLSVVFHIPKESPIILKMMCLSWLAREMGLSIFIYIYIYILKYK